MYAEGGSRMQRDYRGHYRITTEARTKVSAQTVSVFEHQDIISCLVDFYKDLKAIFLEETISPFVFEYSHIV